MSLQLGKEYPEANEVQLTLDIIEAIKKKLSKTYKDKLMLRQFHAKMHGCLKGRFVVSETLPENLQVGVFKAGKQYDCIVRFSNGNTGVVSDNMPDIRGCAIKLLDATTEQLVRDPSTSNTQDFLMVSYPTLMAATVKDFKASILALTNGFSGMVVFVFNPFNWPIIFRTLKSFRRHKNLLTIPYWSVIPLRFGAEDKAVKYGLRPVITDSEKPDRSSRNFLSESLNRKIAKQDVHFEFCVQFQEDPNAQLIENPTKSWDTPYVKLGELIITQQEVPMTDQVHLSNSLTFSPWHTDKAHQPLGAISRARKAAYDAIAAFRLEHNKSIQS